MIDLFIDNTNSIIILYPALTGLAIFSKSLLAMYY